MRHYKMYIDGAWVASSSGDVIDSVEPYSGERWASIPKGAPEDGQRAVMAAHKAFTSGSWPKFTATQRGVVLRKIADLVETNAAAIIEVEQRDNGKLIREVQGQIRAASQWLHYYAGLADKMGGDTVPHDNPDVFAYTRYEPLGVVVAITPWNSPLNLAIWKLAPALAAGNTFVLKPSEHTSATSLELAKLVEQAGLPAGVFNVVTGLGSEIGDALVRHPRVAKIAFTGGEVGGAFINQAAAADFKEVTLELGGKSANIVCSDANIEQAARGAIAGIFGASGQTCVAGSRLLVADSIHDLFVDLLVEKTKRARIGDPRDPQTQMAPITTRDQWNRILELISVAKQEGATCVAGGIALNGPQFGQGQFIAPTIFTDVHNDMRIAREEVFGPVLSVIRFNDVEEAISIANDTDYGLAAGVWTQDLHTAIHCANSLKAGTVWVNNYRMTSPTMPFGGYKRSGIGREGGIEGIREYMQVKSVWITTRPNREDIFGEPRS